jgi:hypothetical protein
MVTIYILGYLYKMVNCTREVCELLSTNRLINYAFIDDS